MVMTTASTLVATTQSILVGVIINIIYLEAVFVICRPTHKLEVFWYV